MSRNRADPSTPGPIFSIIIPLEYHRGQWELCWNGWNEQTVARSTYEIILVVPPDFQQAGLLTELSADRVEFSDYSHDIGLCAAGSATAQGKYLIFTEAHCWPKPDVLEKCQQAIRDNRIGQGSPAALCQLPTTGCRKLKPKCTWRY